VDDPSPAIQKFVADYKARYNIPPDALAALGYDSMKVLADAIKRAGSTENVKLRDAIAQTKDFPGVTGKISIDKDRNAVKPAVVLKLENSKFVYETTIAPEGSAPVTSAPASGATTAGPASAPAAPAKAASPTK
jgi:branched-chain amino acid transport system substrate-binding protein